MSNLDMATRSGYEYRQVTAHVIMTLLGIISLLL